ncbi:MAG: transglycosylase SLT domain-containing protein [Hyphomicrobiales bacterium]
MSNNLCVWFLAAVFSTAIFAAPAEASCRDTGTCPQKMFGASSYRKTGTRHPEVVAMIKRTAPGYGVPTWFALRIAKVESGYNPRARGAAGEYGVFQLKCSTARSIGYSGSCGGLLNASANVKYGLKHLSLAVKSSRGNLKLAASKHNGGLGRKSLVRQYVVLVF